MTDLDDLLDEVAIRTDRSHHWTGKFKLEISDADLAKELAAAVRALSDRPCPHIKTGDDGTSHCMLAEAANTAWAVRWQQQAEANVLFEGTIANYGFDRTMRFVTIDTPSDVVGENAIRLGTHVRVLVVSGRPGGTDNPTSGSPYGPPGDEMADGPYLRELQKRHPPTEGDDG